MTASVVCLGETMALVAPDPPVPLVSARSLVIGSAGAESNVAVGLAGLGTRVAWCSRLGADALGRRIADELAAAGVDTGPVRFSETHPTGVMFKDPGPDGTSVLYYRRGSAASTMDASDVDRALAAGPHLLHLTGITLALSASCAAAVDTALDRAAAAGVSVSFDVNHRPALWPDVATAASALLSTARRCDVVLVGLDEAERLWGTAAPEDVRAALPEPGIVVVKDGARRATAFTGTSRVDVAALPLEVLEVVGAGDAFAAGWLHAHLTGMSAEECLRLGHLVAAGPLRSATDHAAIPPGTADLARIDRPWPPAGWLEEVGSRD